MTDLNLYNEQLVLGTLLTSEEVRKECLSDIGESDFICSSNHSNIIHAIKKANRDGMDYKLEILTDLSNDYKEGGTVAQEYIHQLMNLARQQNININSFKYYLKKVYTHQLIYSVSAEEGVNFSQALSQPSQVDPVALTKIADSIKDKVALSKLYDSEGYISVGQVANLWDKDMAGRKKDRAFIPTGFSHIDYFLVEGFMPGKISVVAGRPGCAKSSFVCNIMRRLLIMTSLTMQTRSLQGSVVSPYILNRPIFPALCALEMNNISTYDRLMAISTDIPLVDLIKNTGQLTEADWQNINTHNSFFKQYPYLYIDDTPRQNLDIIARRASSLKNKIKDRGDLVLFIDLFGRVDETTEDVFKSTPLAYENAIRKAQIVAKDLNIHICMVAQIGRQAEALKDKKKKADIDNRPQLRHLKNTGGFEEYADLVFLLYRQKYYQPDAQIDLCEVNIAKQRQGAMNKVVNLLFEGDTTALKTTAMYLPQQSGLDLVKEEDFRKYPTAFNCELSSEEQGIQGIIIGK